MEEVWLSIEGWNYEASSEGRIRNSATGRTLKPKSHKKKYGYGRVVLCDAVKGQWEVQVSIVVCTLFHGPKPGDQYEVDHINRNAFDDRAENLRWVTKAENLSQRIFHRGSLHGNAKLTEDQVAMLRSPASAHKNNAELARELGVSREQVRDIRNMKGWKHVA